jgi:hypothetical protein
MSQEPTSSGEICLGTCWWSSWGNHLQMSLQLGNYCRTEWRNGDYVVDLIVRIV